MQADMGYDSIQNLAGDDGEQQPLYCKNLFEKSKANDNVSEVKGCRLMRLELYVSNSEMSVASSVGAVDQISCRK
jgi:hypothetical protein